MPPAAVQDERVRPLNGKSIRLRAYVLSWMQASQRTTYNHALEYAAARANEPCLPLVVCFGLMDDYPEANERHYAFMPGENPQVAGKDALAFVAPVHLPLDERRWTVSHRQWCVPSGPA